MKWALIFLFALSAHAATVIQPVLPKIKDSWVYVEISQIKEKDAIVYRSNDARFSPWFTGLVIGVKPDGIAVWRDGGVVKGMTISVYQLVQPKDILCAARAND